MISYDVIRESTTGSTARKTIKSNTFDDTAFAHSFKRFALIYCISPLIRISYNHYTKKDVDSPLPEKEQASSKFENFKLSEEEVKSLRKE